LFRQHLFARFSRVLRSFDDLGTPLHEVTFCVVDLETTGASAESCEITEVGAARFRGGECLGTFQTLVDPGAPIAAPVAALTGITDAMVRSAPPLSQVLPTLAEFVGGSVLVGHNLRFDVSFLDAALVAGDRSRVGLRTVDTLALARRLLRDEVPDCRLVTLARHLALDHQPTHRALDDVLATVDLLHVLLEQAATFGVTVLDDLLQLPRLAAHPQAAKLRLTNRLPRSPGAYVLRDGQGRALHVGSAPDDLRRRVRSLFSGDDQRLAGPLLREVHAVDHLASPSPLAAEVAEIRLVQALGPRRSPRLAAWRAYRYVKVGAGRAARPTVARTPGRGPSRYLGPLPTAAAARAVVDAVELAAVSPAALFDDPALVLSPLHRCVAQAVDDGRYAWAAAVREMAGAVADAVERQRTVDSLRRADRVVLDTAGGGGVELARGRLVRAWDGTQAAFGPPELPADDAPLPPHLADELACVAAWLHDRAHELRPRHVDGTLASTLPPPPAAPAAASPHPPPAGLRCAAC
jgi:DNA polymerase-3 subunit epsilon